MIYNTFISSTLSLLAISIFSFVFSWLFPIILDKKPDKITYPIVFIYFIISLSGFNHVFWFEKETNFYY